MMDDYFSKNRSMTYWTGSGTVWQTSRRGTSRNIRWGLAVPGGLRVWREKHHTWWPEVVIKSRCRIIHFLDPLVLWKQFYRISSCFIREIERFWKGCGFCELGTRAHESVQTIAENCLKILTEELAWSGLQCRNINDFPEQSSVWRVLQGSQCCDLRCVDFHYFAVQQNANAC